MGASRGTNRRYYMPGERPRGTMRRTIRIDDGLWHRLEAIAVANGKTPSHLLRELVAREVGEKTEMPSDGLGSAPLHGVFAEIERDLTAWRRSQD